MLPCTAVGPAQYGQLYTQEDKLKTGLAFLPHKRQRTL